MSTWRLAAAVFVGSGAGGACRYAVALAGVRSLSGHLTAPWPGLAATWTVNLLGSFLLGWLVARQLAPDVTGGGWLGSPTLRIAVTTGFMGGFTTYSTFNTEVVTLLQNGRSREALMYLGATAGSCLLAGWFGMSLGAS